MRPLKLTMEGFGSYRERTTVDFTIPDQRLFLISGDTGSGKSTIFEAMVFALFDQKSRAGKDRRDWNFYLTDFATEKKAFVELEFAQGDKVYRISRILKGKKTASSLIMPDGSEYGEKNVGEKVQEILGLTREEFMQVAMIAQGEYMEILKMPSKNRKEIFRKLFSTGFYDSIVEAFKAKSKKKEQELARIWTHWQTEASRIETAEDYEEKEAFASVKERILAGSAPDVVDMESFLDHAGRLCEILAEKLSLAKEDEKNLSILRDRSRDELGKGEALLLHFTNAEKSKGELAEFAAKEEETTAKAKLAKDIAASYEIKNLFVYYDEAGKNLTGLKKDLEEKKNAIPLLQEREKEAAKDEEQALARREKALEVFTQISQRVDGALEDLEKLARMKESLKKTAEAEKKAAKDMERAKKEQESFEAATKRARQKREALSDAPARYEKWKSKQEEFASVEKELDKLLQGEEKLKEEKAGAKQREAEFFDAQRKYEKKNQEYQAKQAAFFAAQAGLLAARLTPGRPCPVCGSTEHPAPCPISVDAKGLTNDLLEKLADETKSLQSVYQQASVALGSQNKLVEEKSNSQQERKTAFKTKLEHLLEKELPPIILSQGQKILADWRIAFDEQGKKIAKDMEELKEAQKFLDGSEERQEKLSGISKDLEGKLQELVLETSRQSSLAENLAGTLTYPNKEAALAARSAAEKEKEAAESKAKAAKKASLAAKALVEESLTLIKKYTADIPLKEEECLRYQREYVALLNEKEISEEKWQEIVRRYPQREAKAIERELEEERARKNRAAGILSAALEAIGNQEKPNLSLLKQKAEEGEKKLADARKVLEEVSTLYKTNKTALDSLTQSLASRQAKMREHALILSLTKRLSGEGAAGRMDIETFVQRQYLEGILESANMRFREMTGGRYELKKSSLEGAAKNANLSLDLMVYSTLSGKEREISTLSGGESFMAALSLALGTADQIQARSSAVDLAIMFIDEGFGTLDDTARDGAVQILRSMAEKNKLIGIISHVEDLKQKIEDILLVSKDAKGSHLRWQR